MTTAVLEPQVNGAVAPVEPVEVKELPGTFSPKRLKESLARLSETFDMDVISW